MNLELSHYNSLVYWEGLWSNQYYNKKDVQAGRK